MSERPNPEQVARDYKRRTDQCNYIHDDGGICMKCGWCADSPIIWLLDEVDRLRGTRATEANPVRRVSSVRRSAITNRYVTDRVGGADD